MPGFTSHASLKIKWLRVKINQGTPSKRKPYAKPSFYNKKSDWIIWITTLLFICFVKPLPHAGLYQLRYIQTLMFIFQWHPAKPSKVFPCPAPPPRPLGLYALFQEEPQAQPGQVLILKIICNRLIPTAVFFICIIKCLYDWPRIYLPL